jgi:hypothetical protein
LSNEFVYPGTGSITDAAGMVWLITASGDVQAGGKPVDAGEQTAALTMIDGVIYGQDATTHAWWAHSDGGWSPAQVAITLPGAAPSNPALQPSPLVEIQNMLWELHSQLQTTLKFLESLEAKAGEL